MFKDKRVIGKLKMNTAEDIKDIFSILHDGICACEGVSANWYIV
jgi:hypothetical protein